MIETLILGVIAIIASFFTGYFIGETKGDCIHKTYLGWNVEAFKSPINDTFVLDIKKGEQRFSVLFDLAKNHVSWLAKDMIHE